MQEPVYFDIAAEARKVTEEDIQACLALPDFPFLINLPRSLTKDKSYITTGYMVRYAERRWKQQRSKESLGGAATELRKIPGESLGIVCGTY